MGKKIKFLLVPPTPCPNKRMFFWKSWTIQWSLESFSHKRADSCELLLHVDDQITHDLDQQSSIKSQLYVVLGIRCLYTYI